MERDWKYMNTVMNRILCIWIQFPELRLGQLIHNSTCLTPGSDSFYTEDEKLMASMEKFADEHSRKTT